MLAKVAKADHRTLSFANGFSRGFYYAWILEFCKIDEITKCSGTLHNCTAFLGKLEYLGL